MRDLTRFTSYARPGTTGPVVGSNIKALVEKSAFPAVQWDRYLCVVVTAPGCNLCRKVSLEELSSLRKAWSRDFQFVEFSKGGAPVLPPGFSTPDLLENLAIHVTPYSMIIDTDLNVVAAGLVNSPIQIETLIESVKMNS